LETLAKSFELQDFYAINALRVREGYEYLAVGVAIRADGVPYLAQRYMTPLRITLSE